MKFIGTSVPGAFVIDLEPLADERGFFARTFCRDEFSGQGLVADFAQTSLSFNEHRATLRGMHYQASPHGETKIVRCTRGSIHDVIVDLRPESPAYCRWFAVALSDENRRALYIPEGVAHGFLTLTEGAEVSYAISRPFHPGSARGVRWDDPLFAIAWPRPPAVISPRDAGYEDFRR